MRSETQEIFFAECPEGGLSGFLEASIRFWAFGCDSTRVGYIEGWYVDEDVRRQRVGGALARAAGHETIWLGVWQHNLRAKAFDERWQFRPVGTEIFRLGSDDQIDLLMELHLTELVLDQPGD